MSSEQVGSHTIVLLRRSSTAASSTDMVLTHTQSEVGSTVPGATAMGCGVTGAAVTGAGVTGAAVTGAGVTGAGVTGAGVTGAGVTGAGVTGAGVSGKMPKGASVPAEVVVVEGAGVSGNREPSMSDGEGVGLLVSSAFRTSSQVMQRPCRNFG